MTLLMRIRHRRYQSGMQSVKESRRVLYTFTQILKLLGGQS